MNLLHLRLTVFVLYFYKFLTLAAFIQEVRSNPMNPFQIRPSFTPRLVKQTCHCHYCKSIFVACSNLSQKVILNQLRQEVGGVKGVGGGGGQCSVISQTSRAGIFVSFCFFNSCLIFYPPSSAPVPPLPPLVQVLLASTMTVWRHWILSKLL